MYKVLLILQSREMADALCRRWAGRYALLRAEDAGEGWALLAREPDAVVLDLFLAGEDGLSFLREIRRERRPVILALSELVSREVLEECRDLGVAQLLSKPCGGDAIAHCLDRLLENREKLPLP